MIDSLSFIFDFFAFCFLLMVVVVGVTLTYRMFKAMFFHPKNNHQESKEDKQVKDNIIEDSNGDDLVLFDDPIFPEEFDNDDE